MFLIICHKTLLYIIVFICIFFLCLIIFSLYLRFQLMNIINKISVFILSLVLLLSTTGFFLRHHICDSCNISEILINKEQVHKEDQNCEKTCCLKSSCETFEDSITEEDMKCCRDNIFYLKITEPFLSFDSTIDFHEKVIQLFNFNLIDIFDKNLSNQILYTSINKPPDLSGRDILRNNCILRT